jgi:hypothetical protein
MTQIQADKISQTHSIEGNKEMQGEGRLAVLVVGVRFTVNVWWCVTSGEGHKKAKTRHVVVQLTSTHPPEGDPMMNDPNLKCDLAIWGVVRCVFIPLFSFISSRGRGCVYRTYHSRWTAALPTP